MLCVPRFVCCKQEKHMPAVYRNGPVMVVDLSARVAICHICQAETCPPRYGIPIYEGLVLPNSWEGEWGGVDACEACWLQQGALIEPMAIWAFRRQRTVSVSNPTVQEEIYESY